MTCSSCDLGKLQVRFLKNACFRHLNVVIRKGPIAYAENKNGDSEKSTGDMKKCKYVFCPVFCVLFEEKKNRPNFGRKSGIYVKM